MMDSTPTRRAAVVFVADVFRQYRWRAIAIVLFMSSVSVSEGLGIALLMPLLALIGFGNDQLPAAGRVGEVLGAAFRLVGMQLSLITALVAFVAVIAIENTFRYLQRRAARHFLADFSRDLRISLYESYLDAAWPFWIQSHVGHMTSRLTVEAIRVETAVYYLTSAISESIFAAVLLAIAFVVSWQLAVFFLIVGGAFFVAMRGRFRGSDRSGSDISAKNNHLHETVQEHLNAAKFIKTSASRSRSLNAVSRLIRDLLDSETRANLQVYSTGALLQPVTALVLAMGLYIGVELLRLTGPAILVIVVLFYRLAPKIATAQQMWHGITVAAPAYVAIKEERERAVRQRESLTGRRLVTFAESVMLDAVRFAHQPDRPVVRDVTLTVPAMKTIAIVGPSGSGKSTILDLILGLVEPQSGYIRVDGTPLRDIDIGHWRRQIGFVAQDSTLFFDTIRENIRWAVPDASDTDVVAAARLANAHDFIVTLPDGYDTSVGHRGLRLSGGERQRIALARALISAPRLLILDEATSNLDAVSERAVQDAIEGLRSRMSLLVVAHRLATVRTADWIYVIVGGEIIQQGTWDTLLSSSGHFEQLWSLQTGREPLLPSEVPSK